MNDNLCLFTLHKLRDRIMNMTLSDGYHRDGDPAVEGVWEVVRQMETWIEETEKEYDRQYLDIVANGEIQQ